LEVLHRLPNKETLPKDIVGPMEERLDLQGHGQIHWKDSETMQVKRPKHEIQIDCLPTRKGHRSDCCLKI